jgi:hypothetical protein
MKNIFISIILINSLCLFAQESTSSLKFYTGLGYQDVIGPINYGTPIEYVGFELSLESIYTSGVFFDLGIETSKKSHHIGAGVRISQSIQFNPDTRGDKFKIDFLPRAWYSYYFGKQDKRAFRADFSLMLDWEKMGVIYDPLNPSDIPNNQLYVCFGPQVGTRIIRKGAFGNTYLIGGPVFAPPVKFDSFIVEDPSWNIRWMVGLSKSLSFKKSSNE